MFDATRHVGGTIKVQGNAECLHRENVKLCGVWFKFYYPEFSDGVTEIQIACCNDKEGLFSPSRARFLRNMVRGYIARIARKHTNDSVETDEDMEG
jgi:hypothetical protein